jgi:hypothetical protein
MSAEALCRCLQEGGGVGRRASSSRACVGNVADKRGAGSSGSAARGLVSGRMRVEGGGGHQRARARPGGNEGGQRGVVRGRAQHGGADGATLVRLYRRFADKQTRPRYSGTKARQLLRVPLSKRPM